MGHSQKSMTKKIYIKETSDKSYVYNNELDKLCFQYDLAYAVEILKKRTYLKKEH